MEDDHCQPRRCSPFRCSRWGLIITIATFLTQLFGVGLLYSFGIINIAIQEEFNVGVTKTGWVPTISAGLNLIGGVATDELIKRSSYRLVAAVGAIICFAACIITSLMPSFLPILFTFGVLYGIGLALCVIAGMVMIVDSFSEKSAARAGAFAVAGTSTGMLVLNPVMYKMVSGVGWRNALRITGSLVLAVGLAASATFIKPTKKLNSPTSVDNIKETIDETEMTLCKDDHDNRDDLHCASKNKPSSSKDVQTLPKSSYDILKFPEFWMMFTGIIILAMTSSLFLFYWVKLILTLGFDESTSAISMTILGASDLTGKLIVSGIANYLPFPKLFLFHIASVCGIGLMVAVMNIKSLPAVLFISAAIGVLVLSLINATPYVAAAQIYPRRGATPMTTSIIGTGVGIILGAVYGTSVDQTGSFDFTLYGMIGAYAVAIVLFSSVPVYQKAFATERYLMWKEVPSFKRDVTKDTAEGENYF